MKVVVTGIGLVSPIGFDEETFWTHILEGRTGITRLSQIDVSDLRCRVGAEVDSRQLAALLEEKGIHAMDRTVDMAMVASARALEQAGLIEGDPPYEKASAATFFGTGVGNVHTIHDAARRFAAMQSKGLRPTTVPRAMANATSAQIAMRFGLTGPNYMTICACSSATVAIGNAYRLIKDGYADTALCGGTEAMFDPAAFASWNKLGVLSRNPDPRTACRPFDTARDGCVLGEGAGALVLESWDKARARGAPVRGEIVGYGESSDATHITRPDPGGQARAITNALASAGLRPEEVGYINAHGTATRTNDTCEAASIRMAYGDHADVVAVASSKSLFGHLLGASGAVESIATLLALEAGTVPPNLNLDIPDPECNLRLVTGEPLDIESPIAANQSFGFGGNNSVLLFKRWDRT